MKRRPATRPRLLVEELERRILYSADAAALLGLSGVVQDAEVRVVQPIAPAPVAAETAATAQQSSTREIIFIDSRERLAELLGTQKSRQGFVEMMQRAPCKPGLSQVLFTDLAWSRVQTGCLQVFKG